jgi:vacuolar protein 8
VDLLSNGSDKGRANAAEALGSLAEGNNNNKVAIMAAGAIPPLVELLRGGSDEGRVKASGALANLVPVTSASRRRTLRRARYPR